MCKKLFLIENKMSEDQYLVEFARKCNVDSEKIIRKAKELLSILESRKTVACSESCKVAVCLELAGQLTSGNISREMLVKYSGCKKPVYRNTLNLISKILNLDKVYSVKEICLTLGVSEMQSCATRLLQKYQTVNNILKDQLDHPMYCCAATIAACRVNKVRLNLAAVVEIARVKKSELESLIKKMEQLENEQPKAKIRKRGVDGNILLPVDSCPKLENEEKTKSEAEIEEEYLKWKERMLAD